MLLIVIARQLFLNRFSPLVLSHAAVHPTLRGGHFLGRLPKVEKFVCYIDWKISFWATILPIFGKTAQS